jgi:hypothetical protein
LSVIKVTSYWDPKPKSRLFAARNSHSDLCPFFIDAVLSLIIGIMNDSTIVVAGATCNLGGRIARAFVERGARVRAVGRHGAARDKVERLREFGVTIASVDLSSASQVTPACGLRPAWCPRCRDCGM